VSAFCSGHNENEDEELDVLPCTLMTITCGRRMKVLNRRWRFAAQLMEKSRQRPRMGGGFSREK